MNKIKTFAVLVLIAFIGFAGLGLTLNAGDALSTNKGDLLFFNRYFTTSKTPITDLNNLTGSGTSSTTGQIRISDGTDFESKTMSGDATIVAAGTLTIGTGAVTSAKILNGTIAALDMASDAVSAPKLFKNVTSLVIEAGAIGNNLTIPSGSFPMGYLPVSGFSNDYTITSFTNSGTTLFVNTDAHPADMIANIVLIMP